MEISLDTLIAIAGLFLGGGGGAFFTWRYQRNKARAEAEQAETSAAKEMQDVYQQLIADVKTDRQEQRDYIAELKADRQHLREERDELRTRQDELERNVRDLQKDVARNGRVVEGMRPFMCGDLGCKNRQRVTVSGDGDIKPSPVRKRKQQDDESQ